MTDRKRLGELLELTSSKRPRIGLAISEAETLNTEMNDPYFIRRTVELRHSTVELLACILVQFAGCVSNTSLNDHLPATFRQGLDASHFVSSLPDDRKRDLLESSQRARESSDWIAFAEAFCNVGITVTNVLKEKPPCGEITVREKATIAGWKRDYVGGMADELWEHICLCFDPIYQSEKDANLCPIIQSSGTGKSRTVDQLSTKHFVLPICLRIQDPSGFPPADRRVRNYLTQSHEPYRLVDAFLSALFQVTVEKLRELYENKNMDYTALAADFHLRLTEGQTIGNTNQFRRDFYNGVIDRAENILTGKFPEAHNEANISDAPTRTAKRKFTTYTALGGLEKFLAQIIAGSNDKHDAFRQPLVIIAFDETGALTETNGDRTPIFNALLQGLQALKNYLLFSLFLSTTWQMSAPVLPISKPHSSLRILTRKTEPNLPFTGCEFDLFAKKGKDGTDGENLFDLSLSDVTSEWFMAHLGRVLWASRLDNTNQKEFDELDVISLKQDIVPFAAEMLLNDPLFTNMYDAQFSKEQKLACLAHRLPLEFNCRTYLSREQHKKQVENHMRICLQADGWFENMVTVSVSEPVLSEAAFAVMQNGGFDAEDALLNAMSGSSIHKGDRGEYVGLLLLIKARDAVVRSQNDDAMWRTMKIQENPINREWPEWNRIVSVANFIECLFKGLPSEILEGIQKDFCDASMHFSHFFKVHEQKLVRREFLLRLFSRGAGILCANCQETVDAITPYLMKSHLRKESLGAILYQTNNNLEYSLKPSWSLFDNMDPVELGIYDIGEQPLPTIRIVFNMHGKPLLEARRVEVDYSKDKSYIAYDIWCGGLSSEYLRPISKEKERKWASLRDASCEWTDYYKLKGRGGMRTYLQAMNPGVASLPGFWNNFSPMERAEGVAADADTTGESAHEAEEAGEEDDVDIEDTADIDPEIARQLIAQLDASFVFS